MSLPQEFWEQLPQQTDAGLYTMLSHQADYLPEAIEAAKEELRKRKLTEPRAAQLEAESQSETAAEEAMANEPLSWPMRIVLFIVCSGLLGAIMAVYYDKKGFKRKATECWVVLGVSLLFWLVFSFLLAVARASG